MNNLARRFAGALAIFSIMAVAGCQKSNAGGDNFPPPQPEPAAAKAAGEAAAARAAANGQAAAANNTHTKQTPTQ